VRTRLALLVLLVSGCATARGPKVDERGQARLEAVRAGTQAACGTISRVGGAPWSAGKDQPRSQITDVFAMTSVGACARFDPALGAGPGEGAVLAVKLVFGEKDDRYMPEHWHAEVVAQGGLVEYAGMLGTGLVEPATCIMGICAVEGTATVMLPEPWRPGSYKVHLVHVPTQARIDLALELE
jgi:hypothetical protein